MLRGSGWTLHAGQHHHSQRSGQRCCLLPHELDKHLLGTSRVPGKDSPCPLRSGLSGHHMSKSVHSGSRLRGGAQPHAAPDPTGRRAPLPGMSPSAPSPRAPVHTVSSSPAQKFNPFSDCPTRPTPSRKNQWLAGRPCVRRGLCISPQDCTIASNCTVISLTLTPLQDLEIPNDQG